MKCPVLVGRVFYTALFIMASLGHFKAGTVGYAASQGVPMASVLVPISDVMALVGGLSILVGYKAKWGAWLLVAFLVPVTITMHLLGCRRSADGNDAAGHVNEESLDARSSPSHCPSRRRPLKP